MRASPATRTVPHAEPLPDKFDTLVSGSELTSTQTNEYRCDVCDYIYKPAVEGRDLSEQPDDYVCPSCQSTKGHFQINDRSEDDDELVAEIADEAEETDDAATAAADGADGVSEETANLRRVYTHTSDPTVSSLKELKDEGDLDPQPPYQRYEVWTPQKRSKLIESVLMGLPLPRFYFAENEDETQEVVDGQQRLQALFRYMDNEYALTGLKTLVELNKKKSADLDKKLKNRIKNFSLPTVVIQKESDRELRYDLFERLNTGATGLNEQELRNAVFRGEYNDFILPAS